MTTVSLSMPGKSSTRPNAWERATSEVYASSMNSFIRFRAKREIPLDAMDSVMMMEYEAYRSRPGEMPEYAASNLRTLYNRHRRLREKPQSVRHVHTGVHWSASEIIGRIKNLDLNYIRPWLSPEPVPALLLSSRHVFRGLGFEKERFAKRRACLSAAQDRPTALHQMGAAHAGNCPEIHKSGFSLPSSHHQGAGRKGKTAIPECLACDEQAVAKDWPDG